MQAQVFLFYTLTFHTHYVFWIVTHSRTLKTGMLHQNCSISIYGFHHYQERTSWCLKLSLVSVLRLFGCCGPAKYLSKFVSDKVWGSVEFSRHRTQRHAYAIGPFIILLSRVAHSWSDLHFIVRFCRFAFDISAGICNAKQQRGNETFEEMLPLINFVHSIIAYKQGTRFKMFSCSQLTCIIFAYNNSCSDLTWEWDREIFWLMCVWSHLYVSVLLHFPS